MNRGSAHNALNDFALTVASMRPRFMNRGSALMTKTNKPPAEASMRPRFMNRGSEYDRGVEAQRLRLQ